VDHIIQGKAKWRNGGFTVICPFCGTNCKTRQDSSGKTLGKAICTGQFPHKFDVMGLGNNLGPLLEAAVK